MLGQSDFTYLGYYDVVDGLTEAGLGYGLTHRYVSGTFRGMFIRQATGHSIREFTLPGSFGSQCSLVSTQILGANVWNGLNVTGRKVGIWWEASAGRLWSNWGIDYPNTSPEGNNTTTISTRLIADDGTVSDWHGYWGFSGVGSRSNYGGTRLVPQWFQDTYGVGKYVSGFGGYTSLMAQYAHPSLGPIFIFFPDPHGVYTEEANGTIGGIATDQWKFGADHRSGTSQGTDWYSVGFSSRTYERGVRTSVDYVNFFDNGGSHPSTPSSWQPTAKTYGDPTYDGRWTWGDTYDGTMQWIDNDAGTRTKHGIVAVGTFGSGDVWYQNSDLNFTAKEWELHVFDPARVAEVIAGTRQPYDLRPSTAFVLNPYLEGAPTSSGSGSGQNVKHIAGTAFDVTTNRLYMALYGVPNGTNQAKMRLYVFSVGGA